MTLKTYWVQQYESLVCDLQAFSHLLEVILELREYISRFMIR
jgi:hypothetical protein